MPQNNPNLPKPEIDISFPYILDDKLRWKRDINFEYKYQENEDHPLKVNEMQERIIRYMRENGARFYDSEGKQINDPVMNSKCTGDGKTIFEMKYIDCSDFGKMEDKLKEFIKNGGVDLKNIIRASNEKLSLDGVTIADSEKTYNSTENARINRSEERVV